MNFGIAMYTEQGLQVGDQVVEAPSCGWVRFVMSSPVDIFWLKIWWIVMLLSSATRRAVSNTSRLFGEMSVEG